MGDIVFIDSFFAAVVPSIVVAANVEIVPFAVNYTIEMNWRYDIFSLRDK